MKLWMSIRIDKTAIKFDFDDISMNGFLVIAPASIFVVDTIEATIFNGF